MRLNKSISFILAIAVLFAAFAFLSPPDVAANTSVISERSVKAVSTVAVGFADTVKTVAPSAPTNFAQVQHVPPVALPARIEQSITRRFYGYMDSRIAGKIPIKPLNINAVGRAEPAFVPLN